MATAEGVLVKGVLDGVRVLDLTRLLPGPFCTMILGDLGADVIKVEDPAGSDWLRNTPPLVRGESVMFQAVNRNKRSVVIDLKSDNGKQDFFRLLETADVVVEGFRPGVIDRLGIGWPQIHEHNPATILCSISGFGQDGPYRTKAGHDLTYTALSGVLSLIGTASGELAIPGVQIGDIGGGALYAVIAILSALIARQRDGTGQWCDVSMVDGLITWLATQVAASRATGVVPRAGDELLTGKHPCYSLYPCSDGQISVAAIEPQFWQALIATLDLPELSPADGFADGERGVLVRNKLAEVFSAHSRSHWAGVFAGVDACVEPVLSVVEALEHPQVKARGMPVEGFGFRLGATPPSIRRPAPKLGQDTQDLLG